jgi:hypothetical protein
MPNVVSHYAYSLPKALLSHSLNPQHRFRSVVNAPYGQTIGSEEKSARWHHVRQRSPRSLALTPRLEAADDRVFYVYLAASFLKCQDY